MNHINKEIISAKKRVVKIQKKKEKLKIKKQKLQDKIHLYFDSKYDTTDAQKYIISTFWAKAYENYIDGGYITNDPYIAEVRFKYESKKLDKILKKYINNNKRALDIGCGNGRYTQKFAANFDEVVGIDLSQKRIDDNNTQNKYNNITYLNENFITMPKDTLGKFDFVFVGDIFMYTSDNDVEKVFKSLLKLLKPNGMLIVRESTLIYGDSYWKSKGYVAYYRNVNFYQKGIFKNYIKKVYRNYGYSLYYFDKYFNIHKKQKNKIAKKPMLLEKLVEKYIDRHKKSSHFFVYKKS